MAGANEVTGEASGELENGMGFERVTQTKDETEMVHRKGRKHHFK